MSRLLHSAKFMTALIDVVVTLVLYFVGKYSDASTAEDMKMIILTLQPVFVSVIAAFAYEDGKEKGAAQTMQLIAPPENAE